MRNIIFLLILFVITTLIISLFIYNNSYSKESFENEKKNTVEPCELSADTAIEANLQTTNLSSSWEKIIAGINAFSSTTATAIPKDTDDYTDDYTKVTACCDDNKPCLHDTTNNNRCFELQKTQECPTGTTQNKCSDICEKRKQAYQKKLTDLYSYYNNTVVTKINDQVPGIHKMITAKQKQDETNAAVNKNMENL